MICKMIELSGQNRDVQEDNNTICLYEGKLRISNVCFTVGILT